MKKRFIALFISLCTLCACGFSACGDSPDKQITNAADWVKMIDNTVEALTKANANYKVASNNSTWIVANNKAQEYYSGIEEDIIDYYSFETEGKFYYFSRDGVYYKDGYKYNNAFEPYETVGALVYNATSNIWGKLLAGAKENFGDVTYSSGKYCYKIVNQTEITQPYKLITISTKNGLISSVKYEEGPISGHPREDNITYGGQSITLPSATLVQKLAAPKNVQINSSGILTWDAVDNAGIYIIEFWWFHPLDEYWIYIDYGRTQETEVDIKAIRLGGGYGGYLTHVGQLKITVLAQSSDYGYATSDDSEPVLYTKT